MGEILLAGTTHYPLLLYTDDFMTTQMERHWKNDRVPEFWRNQKNWPKEMQEEYGPDGQRGPEAAAAHRDRLVEGFRRAAGDEVAELARRDYGGDPVSDEEWARVFAAFGPTVPSDDELARRLPNPALGEAGMQLMRHLDLVDELRHITCPTLVCVGELDAVTPVEAALEIVEALPTGLVRLEVIEGAGHFPWLDAPDRYFSTVQAFVATAG